MTHPFEHGGCGVAGGSAAGGVSLDGEIGNANARQGDLQTAFLTFDHVHPDPGEYHRFGVYRNRGLEGEATEEGGWDSAPLAEGTHELLAYITRITDWGFPTLWGDVDGRRVYLNWEASGAGDTRAYRVYWDSGGGTIDYGTALATVDRLEADESARPPRPPTSGTGAGRLSVWGQHRGDAVNALWAVEVTGPGVYQWDVGSGLDGVDKAIAQGGSVVLPGGLRLTFGDEPSAYDTGDRWEFRVGPRTWWVSADIGAGSWKFAVTAVDAAGNESAASGERTVVVDPRPRPPTDQAGTWANGTRTVTLTWTASPDGVAGYRVYSDWRQLTGELEDAVLEDGPIQTAGPGAETVDVVLTGSGDIGPVRFYVRAYDAKGREERNDSLVTVICQAVPPSLLDAPSLISVEPGVGGVLTATWLQSRPPPEIGDPVSWKVYTGPADDWGALSLADTVPWTDVIGDPVEVSWTSGVLGAETWIGIEVVDAGGGVSRSNLLSGTPDGAAPGAVTVGEWIPT